MSRSPAGCPEVPALQSETMPAETPATDLPWNPRRFRASREDNSLLASPPLAEVPAAAHQNRASLDASQANLQGRPLARLREWARREVLGAAAQYTSELTGVSRPLPEQGTLYVAGHQPSLFHPGVWAKNFAIGELARRDAGIALNLIVDNDAFSSSAVRLPAGTRENPTYDLLPYDTERPARPWEQARVQDPAVFASFAERAAQAMHAWNVDPVVTQFWPAAVEQMQAGAGLADCLVAGRLSLERQWGLENWELPNSRLCRLDPFFWFASHILAQLPAFRQIHNQVLDEYRRLNRVRSTTHPVPELKQRGDWLEAPFWCWREGASRRGRLFVRQGERRMELAIDDDPFAELPLTPKMDACCAVEVMREFESRGIHFRPRALSNTLFARLCLGDLFVHGIGGSKYDEMTDQIIHRFYKLQPPTFLTLSATLHLPLAPPHNVDPADARRLRTLLRDFEYNPDRHLPAQAGPQTQTLLAEKRALVAERQAAHSQAQAESRRHRRMQTRENHARFRRLREINDELSAEIASQRTAAQSELANVEAQLRANAVLQDREYSFCLFPEDKLRAFMTGLA